MAGFSSVEKPLPVREVDSSAGEGDRTPTCVGNGVFRPQARASRLQWGASRVCCRCCAYTPRRTPPAPKREVVGFSHWLSRDARSSRPAPQGSAGCEHLCQSLRRHPVTVDVGGAACLDDAEFSHRKPCIIGVVVAVAVQAPCTLVSATPQPQSPGAVRGDPPGSRHGRGAVGIGVGIRHAAPAQAGFDLVDVFGQRSTQSPPSVTPIAIPILR